MAVLVQCRSSDWQVIQFFGPFEDDAWANAWLEQHQHDPFDGLAEGEEPPESVLEDQDHWCYEMVDAVHTIEPLITPGFDPTTLPKHG